METPIIFPWHETIWQPLWQRKSEDRLPHALLFSGADGVGKKQFAQSLAHAVLCQSPDTAGKTCGTCRACNLLRADSHPDYVLIEPEEPGQMIKIDQIRELVNAVNETTLLGGYRVIIINPASAMNINAANALLKTLEEPSPKTLLILICNQSMRLPATIMSRCQRITFSKPANDAALTWLKTQVDNQTPDTLLLALKIAEYAPIKAKDFFSTDLLTFRTDLYKNLLQLFTPLIL